MTRTPLRVSFLGGGSDYEDYFRNESGYVLGTTVNLFVYTAVLKHSALADRKFKLSYRQNESVNDISQLKHPLVRAILEYVKWNDGGLHIATLADVPANTGLGSSSAFAVGLLNALYAIQKRDWEAEQLARGAIEIERVILNEAGGWQDQIHSTFGGVSFIEFQKNQFQRSQQALPKGFVSLLNQKMVLVAAGERRNSSEFATFTREASVKSKGLGVTRELAQLAYETSMKLQSCLSPKDAYSQLTSAMNESWKLKRQITGEEHAQVSKTIEFGLSHGAKAAKLCGAGGSGFVLFLIDDVPMEVFLSNFDSRRVQNVKIFNGGSEVGFNDWKQTDDLNPDTL